MVFGVRTINLFNQKKSRLATKIFHKITKYLDFCQYFNFISLFFAGIIAKIIIKVEINDNYNVKKSNRGKIIINEEDLTG